MKAKFGIIKTFYIKIIQWLEIRLFAMIIMRCLALQ